MSSLLGEGPLFGIPPFGFYCFESIWPIFAVCSPGYFLFLLFGYIFYLSARERILWFYGGDNRCAVVVFFTALFRAIGYDEPRFAIHGIIRYNDVLCDGWQKMAVFFLGQLLCLNQSVRDSLSAAPSLSYLVLGQPAILTGSMENEYCCPHSWHLPGVFFMDDASSMERWMDDLSNL